MINGKIQSIVVDLLDGQVCTHVSSTELCLSFVLSPEKARELSGLLFSAYVETQGLGKLPT